MGLQYKYKQIIISFTGLLNIYRFSRNIIKLLIYGFSNRNFIYHIGVFGDRGNVGDTILYNRLEEIFDVCLNKKNKWFCRKITGEITGIEVALINKFCKSVIIGGHGLLMVDSNKNKNSGWQFNIKIKNLTKINKPLIFFAIGYNVFRGQDDFISVFREHITVCVKKSVFFGLRNYGSINALKKYLPKYLHDKLKFQPCPTTITDLFLQEKINSVDKNVIAICLAFDRFANRFGNRSSEIFEQLIRYANYMAQHNFIIQFFCHTQNDMNTESAQYFEKWGFNIVPLFEYTEYEVYSFYKNKKLIIGMRGHSLMIPFGLSIPVISLTNQDKQKWFIETTGHPEWSLEIAEYFLNSLILQTELIFNSYDSIVLEIKNIQEKFKEITECNIAVIAATITV